MLYDKIHILAQIITSRDCCYGKLQLQSGDGYIRVPNEYISIQQLSDIENHQTLNYARLPTIDLSGLFFCSINIPGTNLKLILRDVYLDSIWGRLTLLHHRLWSIVTPYMSSGLAWDLAAQCDLSR